MHRVVASALVVLVVMAGCTARTSPPPACDEDSCPSSIPASSASVTLPSVPTGLPLPNITVPNAQMLDCRQVRVSMEVPLATLRPFVPPAFGTLGFTTSTGGILVLIEICDRVVNGTAVLGSAILYQAFVFVYPHNESWTQQGYVNFYLLDALSDNSELVKFLSDQHLPVTFGHFTIVPASAQGASYEHWTIEESTWRVEFDAPTVPATNRQNLTFAAHLWYGNGPFHRITYTDASDGDTSGPYAEFLVMGQAKLAKAIPGGASPYLGGATGRADSLYRFDGNWTVSE